MSITNPVTLLCTGACERDPAALDWAWHDDSSAPPLSGLICYACDRLIAVYEPALHRVVTMMKGHKDTVRTVKIMKPCTQTSALVVSGSADQSVCIWRYNRGQGDYECTDVLTGHAGTVHAVDCIHIPFFDSNQHLQIVVSTAQDQTIRIWTRSSRHTPQQQQQPNPFTCAQIIKQPGSNHFNLCLSLTYIYTTQGVLLILAAAGVDGKIHLYLCHLSASALSSAYAYSQQSQRFTFVHAVSLAGHKDWIRSLGWTVVQETDTTIQMSPNTTAIIPSGSTSTNTAIDHRTIALFIASASQDKTMRIWKLSFQQNITQQTEEMQLSQSTQPPSLNRDASVPTPPSSPASIKNISVQSLGSRGCIVVYADVQCSIVLESLLFGHEDWIMAAQFKQKQHPLLPSSLSTALQQQYASASSPLDLLLLSCSVDNSVLVWAPTSDTVISESLGEESCIWSIAARLGELNTGATAGIYGAKFGPDGQAIIAHGFAGSLHLWTATQQQAPSSTAHTDKLRSASLHYVPAVCVSGHFAAVRDCCWSTEHDYLITVSQDQTTRIFAPWRGYSPAASSATCPWLEIARPQVHGYDMNCVCALPGRIGHRFASGAEEKVIRVFLAPQPFLHTLYNITGSDRPPSAPPPAEQQTGSSVVTRAMRAQRPELGLTNKGLMVGDTTMQLRGFTPSTTNIVISTQTAPENAANDHHPRPIRKPEEDEKKLSALSRLALQEDEEETGAKEPVDGDDDTEASALSNYSLPHASSNAVSLSVSAAIFPTPPNDQQLLLYGLWPEVEKVYGHGNEILSLCTNHTGTLVASSCQAKTPTQAMIHLYETQQFTLVATIAAHKTSVICMAFDPSDAYLLAGSKDRQLSLTRVDTLNTAVATTSASALPATMTARVVAHQRIIWACAWSPDARMFCSASRDKTVKIWTHNGGTITQPDTTTSFNIQAVATLPTFSAAVTAASFANTQEAGYCLAVGTEDGQISLWRSAINTPSSWQEYKVIDPKLTPAGTIHKLSFKPQRTQRTQEEETTQCRVEQLAAAAGDHTVRIYQL